MLRRQDLTQTFHPAYVVWELTLACDQPCTHCGSRAGTKRPGELSTDEALKVVTQLAALRTREVVLIGGEAYLHEGFLQIISALKANGIRPGMTTGGRGITRSLAFAMAGAGLYGCSVSLDGTEPTHDLMRAAPGSFKSATQALRFMREAGIRTAANTNVNRLNAGDLEDLAKHLAPLGIAAWQVQITAPLGRAADRPGLILQPWDLLELMPRVTALKKALWAQHRVLVMAGNNLGYFSADEAVLRSPPSDSPSDHWRGCTAGTFVMGIDADGVVKGCPSLQSQYLAGSLKTQSLESLWQAESGPIAFNRQRTVDDLWGFCRTCPFAETCLGGCSFTAHAVVGRPGNNPFCHFRAHTLKKRGLRERLVLRSAAPGQPFDNGLFEIREEPFDAADPKPATPRELVKKRGPTSEI